MLERSSVFASTLFADWVAFAPFARTDAVRAPADAFLGVMPYLLHRAPNPDCLNAGPSTRRATAFTVSKKRDRLLEDDVAGGSWRRSLRLVRRVRVHASRSPTSTPASLTARWHVDARSARSAPRRTVRRLSAGALPLDTALKT